MTTLRDKLVKIGAKVVRHGRYVTFQLAEVAVPRDLFRKASRTPVLRTLALVHPAGRGRLLVDSTITEQMGLHVVSRMKGSLKETFDAIDRDGNLVDCRISAFDHCVD